LDTIPEVARRTAEQILAEIGTDIDRFPSAAHLCSWAGLAPGNHESAGKRKSGRTTKGNQKLRSALVEAARAAARTMNTYLSSQYRRIAANRAAVAVAHSILTITYHLLKRKQTYVELGANYYEQRQCERVVKQAIRKLETLSFKIAVEAANQTV
jgi:transposase